MNVLQVTPFFPPDTGGIPDHVYNLSTNLKKCGDNVTILTPMRIKSNKFYNSEFPIYTIPSVYPLSWPYPTLRNMGIPIELGLKIQNIVKNGKFDIIHCHGQHYPICWLAIKAGSKFGIPVILTVHTTYGLNPYKMGGKTRAEEIFNRMVFAFLLKRTKGIIGLTKNSISYCKRYGPSTSNYYQISNGINEQIFSKNLRNKLHYRSKIGIHQDSLVVLFCGRFEHVKGILELTNAVLDIVDNNNMVEVILVGEGSLKENVRYLVRDKSRIHLFDWQSSSELFKFYILSDVFVIPSKYEGLPISLLEAMAATLHIVYTPVGSMPEVLENYPSKTLISESSPTQIYSSLKESILKISSGLGMGHYSGNLNEYDWKNIAEQIDRVYKQTI